MLYPIQIEVVKMRNALGMLFLSILILEKVYQMKVTLEYRFRKVMLFDDLDFLDVSTESYAKLPSVKRYREQK